VAAVIQYSAINNIPKQIRLSHEIMQLLGQFTETTQKLLIE
jgi:hypothetical protein